MHTNERFYLYIDIIVHETFTTKKKSRDDQI